MSARVWPLPRGRCAERGARTALLPATLAQVGAALRQSLLLGGASRNAGGDE